MPAKVAVVKATELVPKAFNGTAADQEEKPDDLLYDLHHLAAVDSHPVSFCVWCACVCAVLVDQDTVQPTLHPLDSLVHKYSRDVCRPSGKEGGYTRVIFLVPVPVLTR